MHDTFIITIPYLKRSDTILCRDTDLFYLGIILPNVLILIIIWDVSILSNFCFTTCHVSVIHLDNLYCPALLIRSLIMANVKKLASISDPNDEVELITPIETSQDEPNDYDSGFVPIFVIRRTSGSPFFNNKGFPFSSGFSPFDIFGNNEETPEIPSFFDLPVEKDDEIPSTCGFLCTILKDFDSQLRAIQDNVKDLHDQTNETDGEEVDLDVNNSTYAEKVCITVEG